jgi:hypothetical protein
MKSPWADVHPFTEQLPTSEAAKSDALADPRTAPSRAGIAPSLYGKAQTLKGDGFTAKFWKQQRHSVTVTVLETGESKRLEAASSHDLTEQLLHLQQNLMVRHLQAQVFPEEPREVWVTDLVYDDGTGERCEAGSYDDLMTALLSWNAKTQTPATGSPHLPLWSVKTANEAIACQQFVDLLGGAYKHTPGNAQKIQEWLDEHNKAVTLKNLVEGFHYLNDRFLLEEATHE